jgi:hypothetical protein
MLTVLPWCPKAWSELRPVRGNFLSRLRVRAWSLGRLRAPLAGTLFPISPEFRPRRAIFDRGRSGGQLHAAERRYNSQG